MKRVAYEALGRSVWHGARWYVRRRVHDAMPSRRTTTTVAAITAGAVLAVVAGRRLPSAS